MAVTVTRLASGVWTGTMDLLGQNAGKARIVAAIRVVNKGTTTATLNLSAWRATNAQGTEGDERLILPKDLRLPAGYQLIEEKELTLNDLDKLKGSASGGSLEYHISGIERAK